MDFVKMHGLGNDFIIVEGPCTLDPDDVLAWCHRRRGIGADGVIVATALSSGRVSMRHWNADGSQAEICGNGLRCVAQYAYDREWVDGSEFIVESAVGDHPVSVAEESIVAYVGEPMPFRSGNLMISGHDVYPFAIGNPHAVLFVDDVDTAPVEELGPMIENDPLFPNRTNVEFVEVLESDGIRVRVWERGVGETQASGTGATASAYIAHTIREVPTPMEVHLPGGVVRVWFDDAGAWMDAPVEYAFAGSID